MQCLTQSSPCHPPVLSHPQQCGHVCIEAAEAIWSWPGSILGLVAQPMISVLCSVHLCNVTWGCQTICLRHKSLKIITKLISTLDTGCSTQSCAIIRTNHADWLALAWEASTRCTLTPWNQEYVRAYTPWFVSLCRTDIHWTHMHF